MLTLDDCIAFGDLSRDVVLAIAEHQRVPEMSAVAIGQELVQHADGLHEIHDMLISQLQNAAARGDAGAAAGLRATLARFVADYPSIFS